MCLWGDYSSVSSHDLYLRRSFYRSIVDFITVLYSASKGVLLKGGGSHNRDILSMMAMHVDAIYVVALMRRCAAPISVLPIRMRFGSHLMRMSAIMWSILRRQNL